MTQIQRTPKAEATRLLLLETGTALVLRRGFAGLGLQEILATSGVPKGSFYHYFASKEAFGVAVLQHYIAQYAARLEALLEAPGTGHSRLLRYFQAWILDPDDPTRPGWAAGCLVVKLSAEVADLSEDMRLVLEGGVTRLIARLAMLLAEAADEGARPDDAVGQGRDATALARLLYQMWLGAALLAKLTRQDAPLFGALGATETLLACHVMHDTRADPERTSDENLL